MSNSQEAIRQRQRFYQEQLTARTKNIDPVTGQPGFVHSAENRRKAQMQLDTLNKAMDYQAQQDARMAQQVVAQRNAEAQQQRDQYAESQAIRQRAQAIRVEKEAQRLADSAATLTGPGSEVSVVRSA